MQIRETDFLWKCYKRYYKSQNVIPHPYSICNFIWKAVFGMLFWLIWDLPGIIVYLLFAGAASFFLVSGDKTTLSGAIFIITGSILVFTTVLVGVVRYYCYWNSKENGKTMNLIGGIVGGIFLASLYFSIVFCGKSEWNFMYFFYGFLTTIAFVGIGGAAFLFSKTFWVYFKTKVCLPVKAPWEETHS